MLSVAECLNFIYFVQFYSYLWQHGKVSSILLIPSWPELVVSVDVFHSLQLLLFLMLKKSHFLSVGQNVCVCVCVWFVCFYVI